MSSFDVVSEIDRQEVKNAIDQAQREIATRFDFKNTDSSIEHSDLVLTLRTVSEDRLAALHIEPRPVPGPRVDTKTARIPSRGRGSHAQ